MPPLVLMKKDWFWSFFSRFSVETVHYCDCCSEVWSESHRCISAWFVQCDIPVFLISLVLLRGWAIGVAFLWQFIHLDALLLGPANFELRITIFCISLKTIVNSIKNIFDTSLPRVVGHEMLFLCVGFAVPSTVGSPLLDDVVRDGESIQSPLTKILTGFAFFQELFTSAIDDSMTPIKKGIRSIALLELFGITRITLHCPFHESSLSNRHWMGCRRYFAANRLEVLLDEDDSRSSSRVREHEVLCLFHNCMWQSRHSEVNVYLLALCEQTDGLSTLHKSLRAYLICVYVFVCVFVFI